MDMNEGVGDMQVDLLAGQAFGAAMMQDAPTILVFDSGLGGLTVFAELVKARPDARFVYAADDAGFPYGRLNEAALVARVLHVMERLIAQYQPDLVVIACNTASTLVLPQLRARFAMPFVGTVPAIKPAAQTSLSRIIAVLATPGTVARDYTQGLIREFAGDCRVVLVGASSLAAQAEALLRGESVDDDVIRREMLPCFVEEGARRTDVVALSCTHFPLLLAHLERLAPWPVRFIDPAAAIARRMVQVLGATAQAALPGRCEAVFTGDMPKAPLQAALEGRGFGNVTLMPVPLHRQ